jgi:hypothetical protein
MLPDIKNQNNWIERLKREVEQLPGYVGHYMVTSNAITEKFRDGTSDSLDLSDVVFIDVKSLKLPPLPKTAGGAQTQYLVYLNGYRQGTYTPDELEQHVIDSKKSTVDLDSKWWETVSSINELNFRSIDSVKGTGTYNSHYTANSQKFVDAMHELGWLSTTSQEYKDTILRINAEQERAERMRNAEPTLRNVYFDTDFHPNLIKAIVKDQTKIDRLKTIRDSIMKDDTTRARILRKLSRLGSYDGARRISRGDLRKILTLK